jgi:hypothetical protein
LSILSVYSYAKFFILVGSLWFPSPLEPYTLIKADMAAIATYSRLVRPCQSVLPVGIDGDSEFFMVLPNVFVIEVLKINICHNL